MYLYKLACHNISCSLCGSLNVYWIDYRCVLLFIEVFYFYKKTFYKKKVKKIEAQAKKMVFLFKKVCTVNEILCFLLRISCYQDLQFILYHHKTLGYQNKPQLIHEQSQIKDIFEGVTTYIVCRGVSSSP